MTTRPADYEELRYTWDEVDKIRAQMQDMADHHNQRANKAEGERDALKLKATQQEDAFVADWNSAMTRMDALKAERDRSMARLSTATANCRYLDEENDALKAEVARLTAEPTDAEVERVAEAIWSATHGIDLKGEWAPNPSRFPWARVTGERRDDGLRGARAAIAAMRKGTPCEIE